MVNKTWRKQYRQNQLMMELEQNPFATDEELARLFGVSVQTIRLDRLSLKIPETRERIKAVARGVHAGRHAIFGVDMVGELLDLQVGKVGISLLEVTESMVWPATRVACSYYLYAQANTLVLAVIGGTPCYISSARVRYKRSISLHERVLARATVKLKREQRYLVSVRSQASGDLVFKGQFILLAEERENGKEVGRHAYCR